MTIPQHYMTPRQHSEDIAKNYEIYRKYAGYYLELRHKEFLECNRLKGIYWLINYRLPCDVARKIYREYLFPRDVILTIATVEEDDFWTMHYIWQENGKCKFLSPPGTSPKYRIMNLNYYGTTGYNFLANSTPITYTPMTF
jgi:hypothetical protein